MLPIVRKLISRQEYYPLVYALRVAARARLGPVRQAYESSRAWDEDILLLPP